MDSGHVSWACSLITIFNKIDFEGYVSYINSLIFVTNLFNDS